MHRLFQNFIDRLNDSVDVTALRTTMPEAAASLDLNCFAYLSMPTQPAAKPQHVTTYPPNWTAHYLRNHYERLDPVIAEALSNPEPFEWGMEIRATLSKSQRRLLDEASSFDIRCGFTVPIHDGRGPIAAVTFSANEHRIAAFRTRVAENRRVLQLMAMYFHAHARRKLIPNRVIDGAALSRREFECLQWASHGKSAWEIGRILNISRRTAAFHLDNAKTKLRVRSICQAVAILVASRPPAQ